MVLKKDDQKLKLDYPCQWTYKVVGIDEKELREAVQPVMGGKPHTIQFSNKSSGGKYRSLNVDVQVETEKERNAFYEALKASPGIKMVL